eukprot:8643315-Pyramimonas_sp.AAC.1
MWSVNAPRLRLGTFAQAARARGLVTSAGRTGRRCRWPWSCRWAWAGSGTCLRTPEWGAENMCTMSNNKCCPNQTAAAVWQAAFCLKWT